MKVLILQPDLVDYRVDIYNILNKDYHVAVGYAFLDKTKSNCEFEKIKLNTSKLGPLFFIKGLYRLCNKFDVVIIMADLHYPQYCIMPFLRRKYKVLTWGIGFRVSYIHPYLPTRKHGITDKLLEYIMSRCDANILYMEKAKDFWRNTQFPFEQMFVAPNTTSVVEMDFVPERKKNFLFVGTLYRSKGIDILISSFSRLVEEYETNSNLVIVGEGAERNNLEDLVNRLNLTDRVIFKGAIYDEHILAKEFQEAILCISPTQGGLSVPKSMGYGVPFVVRKDAITGGEIYHITNDENGILYEKDSDLLQIMKNAINNPKKYIDMGKKAKEYYNMYATPECMAKGAMDAINYALSLRK